MISQTTSSPSSWITSAGYILAPDPSTECLAQYKGRPFAAIVAQFWHSMRTRAGPHS